MSTFGNTEAKTLEEGWAVSVDSLFFDYNKEFELPKTPVIAGKMILEFHKDGISPEEFATRNKTYEKMGYRTAWIFDVSQDYEENNLVWDHIFDNKQRVVWRNPRECLVGSELPQDTNKNYAVYLVLDEPGYNMKLRRVIRSSATSGKSDYRQLLLSPVEIAFSDIKNPEVFFWSKKDWMNRELSRVPVYQIKKIGVDHFPEPSYFCGKRDSRGIKMNGATGCECCKYCAATEQLADKSQFNVYCCYPNVARVPDSSRIGDCAPAKCF